MKILNANVIKKNFMMISYCSFCIVLFLLVSRVAAAEVSPDFAGGSGTKSDPYMISNAEELTALSARISREMKNNGSYYSSANYVQTEDIDLSQVLKWLPIGASDWHAFEGVYDGRGHEISNIAYGYPEYKNHESYDGLFGVVSGDGVETGILRGIRVRNSGNIVLNYNKNPKELETSDLRFGVIVGCLIGGKVEGCNTGDSSSVLFHTKGSGNFNIRRAQVGCIVGEMRGGQIENCVNNLDFYVLRDQNPLLLRLSAGGIVGAAENGVILNCINNGANYSYSYSGKIGGIVGWLKQGSVFNSINTGNIETETSRDTYSGGIGGLVERGEMFHCVNKGSIYIHGNGRQGDQLISAGGLAGHMSGEISESSNIGKIRAGTEYINTTGKRYAQISGFLKEELFVEIKCGGLVGSCDDRRLLRDNLCLLNVSNTGNIEGNIAVKGLSSHIYFGGLIGAVELHSYDMALQNSLNTGRISIENHEYQDASVAAPGDVGLLELFKRMLRNYFHAEKNPLVSLVGVGGIIGLHGKYKPTPQRSSQILGCFWLEDVGSVSAIGKEQAIYDYINNDSYMLTSEEFERSECFKGWDFEKIWKMSQEDPKIPVLRAFY